MTLTVFECRIYEKDILEKMTTIIIKNDYQLKLPPEIQKLVPVGTRFEVTVDETGRIVLVPELSIKTILLESFGMWADRTDQPVDGVTYVDKLRRINGDADKNRRLS